VRERERVGGDFKKDEKISDGNFSDKKCRNSEKPKFETEKAQVGTCCVLI
jgi:hypothetical protein